MKRMTPVVPLLATLALAACGGGAGAQDKAGQPDDKAELAFAKCMRAAGIDFPDPAAPGSGPQVVRIGRGTAPQKLRAATETCRKQTGGGPKPPSEEQQAQFRDAALKFAQCMRRNGVDVPDPQVGSGGDGFIQTGGGPGRGPDPRSPAFPRAQKAGEKLLPGRGGRAGQSVGRGGAGASVTFSAPAK
jgi:hypothetical protein